MNMAINDKPLQLSRLRTALEEQVARPIRGHYFIRSHKNFFNLFQDGSKEFIDKMLLDDWWAAYWKGY